MIIIIIIIIIVTIQLFFSNDNLGKIPIVLFLPFYQIKY